nr:MAG TPA: Polysaccharide pyruvyl transferase [Caudoviricetes sp.]
MQYALFKYETENIGDEIQSIAARRFLPAVDILIDRDRLGSCNVESDTKIIANGWFMHSPYQWPPKSAQLDPLLISMYIDQSDPRVINAFFNEKSINYMNEHGPVGARDLSTLKLLQEHGVDAYFSGCMTLTLQKDPDIAKENFILAVDLPQAVVEMIRRHTNRAVIQTSPYFDADMSQEDRFQLAEYFLFLYQSAHAVVSTRLHAMLPALAFGTPVFLIKDQRKYDEKRYAGLDDLVNSATDEEYLNDYSLFDVDVPPSNPDKYLILRQKLIAKASEFTHFNNDYSFRTVDFSQIASNESYIRLFTKGFSSLNRALLLEGDKAWLQEQNKDLCRIREKLDTQIHEMQIDQTNLMTQNRDLQRQIEEIKQSSSWKIGRLLTAPGRKMKDIFKGKQG